MIDNRGIFTRYGKGTNLRTFVVFDPRQAGLCCLGVQRTNVGRDMQDAVRWPADVSEVSFPSAELSAAARGAPVVLCLERDFLRRFFERALLRRAVVSAKIVHSGSSNSVHIWCTHR